MFYGLNALSQSNFDTQKRCRMKECFNETKLSTTIENHAFNKLYNFLIYTIIRYLYLQRNNENLRAVLCTAFFNKSSLIVNDNRKYVQCIAYSMGFMWLLLDRDGRNSTAAYSCPIFRTLAKYQVVYLAKKIVRLMLMLSIWASQYIAWL